MRATVPPVPPELPAEPLPAEEPADQQAEWPEGPDAGEPDEPEAPDATWQAAAQQLDARVRYAEGYTPIQRNTDDLMSVQSDVQIEPSYDKNGRRKWTAMEVAEQVYRTQELLTRGYRPNVIRSILHKEYGIATPTAEARLRAARTQMVNDINTYDRKEKVSQMVQQLEEVVLEAFANNREANVIGALRLQADLLQLYQKRN